MKALFWLGRQNCSHKVSQKVKRIRRLSERIPQHQGVVFGVEIWGFELGVFRMGAPESAQNSKCGCIPNAT